MDFYSETDKTEISILQNLKQVMDPELGINIVDLGLVYKVRYNAEEKTITVTFTLSSPGCPMGEAIMKQMRICLEKNYPGSGVDLQLVWEPKWSRDFISPAGAMQLGF